MVEAGGRGDPRGGAARGARARARGDHQALRGAGGAPRAGRQAEVARPELTDRARASASATGSASGSRTTASARPARSSRRSSRRSARRSTMELDRGGHRPSSSRHSMSPRHAPRQGAPGGRRGARARAVRGRPARADRGRAGLEGAEVGQAHAALRPDHRDGRAAVPGRAGDGRRRGTGGQGRADAPVREEAAEAIYKDLVRQKIAVDKRRPDGRAAEEIRADRVRGRRLSPRTHGSALFTRGQTQIMSLLTLGTAKEGQRIDDLSLEQERRFMHHYNFPPYSVGETGFMRGPKRRDIGHGALAQRALEPVIPAAGGVPVHDPDRLRDARVERLVVDGLGLRLDARADGRRRADQGAGRRASRWASSRRATTT